MKLVDAMGDACPIPVVKTKKAIEALDGEDIVETLVDNDIAVQNLTKMANQNGYGVNSEKLDEGQYRVIMTIPADKAGKPAKADDIECAVPETQGRKKNVVVAVSSATMGSGDDELGAILMKSFIYALGQQDELPATILFYNGGAKLTTQNEDIINDLKDMQDQGVEIMTCGTCLNHYGLADDLKVGTVTNMYDIVEKLTTADLVVKP